MTTKTKITVTNELGTISRTTARLYTHVVMCVTNANSYWGVGSVGNVMWTANEKAAHKMFEKQAWRVTTDGEDFDTLAVCTIDGTIVRRLDRVTQAA